ncbi:TPA: GNAT family N-acetyltransferase [Providencia rettgeri]|nr:GNAT family N-acetyltransferase [Providencia rettgeri]HEM7544021.1 GNAT family N-acetyltransferase [Providencia rettgeri]HEM8177483.1 GNAT family N-acetyltransferase [Providencia rettgeri]HEM8340703.1 GNAT family N-acetyltransferase [Providencia rettgeri]
MELNTTAHKVTTSLINDLKNFYSLYYTDNNRLFEERYIPWLLDSNPAGQGEVITVTLGDELIASMFIIPLEIISKNNLKLGYYVTDVLSHPQHRDKNLFVKMIRFLIEKVKIEKKFIIGHPNKNAMPGWKRTKMAFQPPLKNIIYVPKIKSCLTVRKEKIKSLEQLQKINKYLCISMHSDENKVNANANFLYWRYYKHPTMKYDIVSYYIKDKFIGLTVEIKTKKIISKVIHVDILSGYEKLIYSCSLPKIFILPSKYIVNNGYKIKNKDINYFFTEYIDSEFNSNGCFLTLASSDI